LYADWLSSLGDGSLAQSVLADIRGLRDMLMFSNAGRLRVVAVAAVVRFAVRAFFGGSPTAPSVRAAAFARVTRVEAMFSAFSSVTVRLAVLAGGIVTERVVEEPW